MQTLVEGVYEFPQTITRNEVESTFHPAAVETDRGIILIDVGFPQAYDQLEASLTEVGYEFDEVWAIVLTHQDGDHVAALSTILQETDPIVCAHRECAPYVDGRLDPIKGGGDRYPAATIDIELADETTFDTEAGPMEVVHTPGHTPGHIALYFPEIKLLLAGDALTAPEGELAGPNEAHTLDMDMAIESVGRLADLDIEQTYCYHGGFVAQGTGAIAQIWTESEGSEIID